MATNKLFPWLPRMDSNFNLEEANIKFGDYFRFLIAPLINSEHLRVTWMVSKLYLIKYLLQK